ncbi:30S ribosomal protein S19 [Candidatus Woesearchaeota archaeon CG10_big_fil_rev_8_21_14_0_10_44_13]|nr:MAG: 30S ribosomal protein S19 [Candidatus Woesearchaeota archaeon CG10_big_fil_rev_8_21_14_0_10_44_13]
MAKKDFTYRGKSLEELQAMSLKDFIKLLPSRQRRSLTRGLPDQHKKVLAKVKKKDPNLKTQCRDMVILPEMVNSIIKIYNGKEFVLVSIAPHMIGHYLGEFAFTRKGVKHSAPGIGATRSSASVSVR